MSAPTPDVLPPFPVDDFTLDLVEEAMNTCYGDRDPETGVHERVGGDFTLSDLLLFLSGYDESRVEVIDPGREDDEILGIRGSVAMTEYHGQLYTDRSVIESLITEVRRLRGTGEVTP